MGGWWFFFGGAGGGGGRQAHTSYRRAERVHGQRHARDGIGHVVAVVTADPVLARARGGEPVNFETPQNDIVASADIDRVRACNGFGVGGVMRLVCTCGDTGQFAYVCGDMGRGDMGMYVGTFATALARARGGEPVHCEAPQNDIVASANNDRVRTCGGIGMGGITGFAYARVVGDMGPAPLHTIQRRKKRKKGH